ncbi:hypothetical protein GCM10009688_04800 [Arthrobacter gandavensis]|uniref:Uncharacterized protein n=1 Tax=Arthrobacter gandavensis TaxID=169960 RepID=A0ABN2NY87_9MICC|nr:hypothetical protein [Arthrobacter citreus]
MTNGPESADAPRRSRRAAGSGTAAGAQERESQQRARDREALRAYKALTDSQPRHEPAHANPPTRRQLRLAQQAAAQQAALDDAGAAAPAAPQPAAEGRMDDAASRQARRPGQAAGTETPSQPGTRRERRRAAAAAAPAGAPESDASTGQAASAGEAVKVPAPEAPVVKPLTPAPQRAPAVQEGPAAGGMQSEAAKPARPEPNADVANMTVEQALAAREALKHQARNQVAAMEALQQSDPHAVDLELLAQQRALAERAAVLNRRTQNIQRLAQENEQRRSSPSDPTTAHNLAMVTPLEFVEVPGLDRPVMRPPATSHVPVVTSSNPAAARVSPGTGRPGTARRPARPEESSPAARAEVRHSKILARADALVNAPLEADQGAKPVGARSAFGLDPLDVMTAGLGRTRRIRFVSLGIVGVGLIALTLGVLMIVGGLGS